MKYYRWQAALLIAVSFGVNIKYFLVHPQLVLAQYNENRKEEAQRLLKAGREENQKGNSRQALELFQRALPLFKANGDRFGEASVINSFGEVYRSLGQYPKAIEYYQQSLKIRREVRDRIGEANTLNDFGEAYHRLGEYSQASNYYQQSLLISKELGNLNAEGIVINNLGVLYYDLGLYEKAISFYKNALEINKKTGNTFKEGAVLNNLGQIYYDLRQYKVAIKFYQQSLEVKERIGNRSGKSNTLNNLGSVYNKLGQYQQSIIFYKQALVISQELGNRLGESANLHGLGEAHQKLGEYSQSIEYYKQALVISRKLGHRLGESAILNSLGEVYRSLGEYSKAIDYYQQALQISRNLGNRSGEGNNLSDLGYTSYILNQLDDANNYLQKSVEIKDKLRSKLNDKDKISLFEGQSITYKLLSLIQHRQGKVTKSLITSERGRTRAFQELLAQKQNLPKPITPTFVQLQALARQNQSTIVEYSIIPKFEKNDPRPQDELFIYIITPDGKLTVRTQPLSAATALSKLVVSNRDRMLNDPNNIASRGQNSTANSTLYEKQPVKIKGDPLTAPSRQIIKIDRVKNEVEVTGLAAGKTDVVPIDSIIPQAQSTNARYDSLRQLHKLLIAPIADLLPTNPNSSVIFIPDSALFEVPFAALQDAEGKYLIDKHTVLTAPSLGVLMQTSQIQPQGNQALVLGNPSMPKPREPREVYKETQLQPLPFSEAEARAIANLYQTQPLIGAAATKKAVTDKLSSYRVIHLSTHGILNEDVVGESAIALAPGDGDDGYLTVNEILDLKLNADLVVLSACDTGRGEISGDGVVGLSRALMTAGSRSLIVSLWSVNDKSTSELMQEFYRQWQNGKKSKAVALREAMLKVRQQYPAPYHWAGMTLMGEEK